MPPPDENTAENATVSDMPKDNGASASPFTLKTFATGRAHLADVRKVKDWVRQRYSLQDDETCMVSEVACQLPGCPPVETVIAFWTEGGDKRHHYKIFKPLADVTEDDLPPYWMKQAMVVDTDFYCSCC
ncbi:MAG: hypothetical protein KDJ29_18835 [Hyphomicrobiales bacterium]|nr:hypothetical protein [Hyphomicrobiales bacterium]